MSERPKWMPNEKEQRTVALKAYAQLATHGRLTDECEDVFRCTGLRAQIAVLEEVKQYGGRGITDKIAALRKELEQ